MKRLRMLLAAGIVFSVTGAALCQGPRPTSGPARPEPMRLTVEEFVGLDQLALTDEQKQKLKDLRAEWQKANQEWQAANKDKLAAASKAIEEARRNQDRPAMRKAGEEYQALMAPQNENRQKMLEQFLAILTPGQKTKYFENRALEALKRRFAPAKLTEDQLAKAREIVADLIAAAKDDQEKAGFALLLTAAAQVEKEILTDAQREALKAATSRPVVGSSPDSPAPPPRPASKE